MKIREAVKVEAMPIPEALTALQETKESNAHLLLAYPKLNDRLDWTIGVAEDGHDQVYHYLHVRNASKARGESRSCYGKTCKALSKIDSLLTNKISDQMVADETDKAALRVKNGLLLQGVKPLMTGSYDAQAQHFKKFVAKAKKEFWADIEFLGMTREFDILERFVAEFRQELKMGVEGVAYARVTEAQDDLFDAMTLLRAELVLTFPTNSPEDVEARSSFLAAIVKKEKEAARLRSQRGKGISDDSVQPEEGDTKEVEGTAEPIPNEPVDLQLADQDVAGEEEVTIHPVPPANNSDTEKVEEKANNRTS